MKEKKRVTALLMVIVLLTALLPTGAQSAEVVYTGLSNGDAVIKNASFTDLTGNANADNILKMAVYSVINEYGNTQYRPKDYATRQEVLANLVSAMGKEADAIAAGEALKKQDPTLSTTAAYQRGHIEAAKTAGILSAADITAMGTLTKAEQTAVENTVAATAKQNWKMTQTEKAAMLKKLLDQKSNDKAMNTAATREEIALWTAKALGLAPVTGQKTMELYAYKDWKSIASANIPYLEAVHRGGILKGETTANYNPKGKVTRGDLAAILNRAVDNTLPALGFITGFGKVTSKNVNNDVTAYNQTTTTNIVVQTSAGENLNLKAISKTTGTKKENQSIPVIKNGKVGNESLIQNNDIVEYTLTQDNKVQLLQVGKLKELKGKFLGYNPTLGTVQLQDAEGKKVLLNLLPTTVTTAQKSPINIANATPPMTATAIYEGNNLRAIDLDVAADKVNNQDVAVTILYADPLGNVLKIEDEKGNRQYLQIASDADIYINDELQGIEAIGFDQTAVLKVADNRVQEVRVYTDVPTEEEPYTRVLTGRVREVAGNNLFISPDSAPETQNSYILGSNVPIIKDKQNVSKYKLEPGDRVKIYIDSTMGDYVSRIEVQGAGVTIANLYKGDIKDILPGTNEIILSNVYTYGYLDWVKKGDYIKYKLSDDVELYSGNNLININNLKNNIGSTIYAVSKNNYGSEEIVHGLLKNGGEDSTYKTIDDVKYTASQLTLSDGRILDYVKGSIIIQNGKLMDPSDLKKSTSAFVIQNKGTTGARTASIVSMNSFSGIGGYIISKGYLHTMGEDYFTMETGARLNNNAWEKYNGFTYQLSDDTYIYDNVIKNSAITADKFAESRYKPYTYTWTNYTPYNYGKEFHEDDKYHNDYKNERYSSYYHEHSMLYTITDEYGNALGINIYTKDKEQFNPNRTNDERISSGQVQKVDSANNVITITKAMEFSPLYQEWRPATVSIPLDTEKALVMKDGKPVKLDDITTSDSIYAVSINGTAVIILVK